MAIRGILFDLDGTLVDSLGSIAAAVNSGRAAFGLPPHPVEAVSAMVGEGVKVLCQKALPAGRQDLIEPMLAHVWAHYEQHLLDHTAYYPGIPELIAALHRRGLRLGVLSNKPDALTRRTIAELRADGRCGAAQPGETRLDHCFRCVRGERQGIPRKPAPDGAFAALDLLGLTPDEVLYAGDTPIDVATARAAGMRSIAVTWGFRSRALLAALDPDHLVDAPHEIAPLAS